MDSQPISLIIVDNHRILCESLKVLLGNREDIVVVGSTLYINSGQLIREMKPRIALFSLVSNHGQEIEPIIQHIIQVSPATQVLLMGRASDDNSLLQGLRAGAAGCLTDESSLQDLIDAVSELARGGTYIPSRVGKKLIQKFSNSKGNIIIPPQQMRVLRLICRGYTNQEIARVMAVSKRTIEMHAYRLYKRLDATNRAQAIQIAIQKGILEPSDFYKEERGDDRR